MVYGTTAGHHTWMIGMWFWWVAIKQVKANSSYSVPQSLSEFACQCQQRIAPKISILRLRRHSSQWELPSPYFPLFGPLISKGNTQQHQTFCRIATLNHRCFAKWIACWNEHCCNPKESPMCWHLRGAEEEESMK